MEIYWYHKPEVSKAPFKPRVHLLNLVLTTVVAPLGTFPLPYCTRLAD